ncbi:SDR family oxidoreductase [Paenibacillus monticola]|uniref:NAD(P)H-binding protein n=1 Tax=Paenibacillus monticola TaxID=2666075 RepID=A0A7X2H7T5_9BACL|nr:SDR family oxidoreductase [Paenibacillus monticola]MRN55122.1 NAD(P)H-binding protein [Paenibacillus monticola]
MSILITGATGKLGSLIIEQLLQKVPSSQIIACVRHTEKAEHYIKLGIEVRFGDYDQLESIEMAFSGITQLLLISSSHTDDSVRLVQHSNVIAAAKKAGVKQLLYTSFAFPRQGPIPTNHVHRLTEQVIFESGLDYTILRNALYTDFVGVLGLNEAIDSGKFITYPGNWQFNTVTRQDLAIGTAQILTTSGHVNQIYELTAPRPWDFSELSAILSELAGKPVVHREDSSIQNWIYAFLSKIDTVSTSEDLERFMGCPITPLKDSILPFINPVK